MVEEELMLVLLKGKTSKEVDRASKEAGRAFKKAGGASEEAGKGGGGRKREERGKGEEEAVDSTTSSPKPWATEMLSAGPGERTEKIERATVLLILKYRLDRCDLPLSKCFKAFSKVTNLVYLTLTFIKMIIPSICRLKT